MTRDVNIASKIYDHACSGAPVRVIAKVVGLSVNEVETVYIEDLRDGKDYFIYTIVQSLANLLAEPKYATGAAKLLMLYTGALEQNQVEHKSLVPTLQYVLANKASKEEVLAIMENVKK